MWLSKMFSSSREDEKAEYGNVTMSVSDKVETASSVNIRETSTYSPYGYSAKLPVGERVMLVPSADGQAIVGTRNKEAKLEAGEIEICSKGGAKIVLKNDGSVVINSLTISKEGEIIK